VDNAKLLVYNTNMFQQFFANTSPDEKFFGNSIFDYAVTLLIFFVVLLLLELLRQFLWKRCHSVAGITKFRAYELWGKITNGVHAPFIIFLALYVATMKITLQPMLGKTLTAILIAFITYQVILATEAFADYQIAKKSDSAAEKDDGERASKIAHFIVRTIFGITGFLAILSVYDINITSILAGLGISGIVIAFAAQNILGDLFSSLSIFLDKPFVAGDFISIGGTSSGTVEKIGLKTTRLRGMQGEELVVSNKELTTARIQNYGDMNERRVSFNFKTSTDAPSKKLREFPSRIKEIVEKDPRSRFDTAVFSKFGEGSLDFEVIYYITPPDWSLYLEIQNRINLEILEALEKEKIKLAEITK